MTKADDAHGRLVRFQRFLRETRGAFTSALAHAYDTDPGSELKPLGDAVRELCDDILSVCGAVEDAEDYRERLHDLVTDESERRAIGGGPGWQERHAKSWSRAMELFEP